MNDLISRAAVEPEKRTAKRTETHACDCIYRQAAIETLDRFNVCGYVEEPWEKLRDALQELPAAQPEPRWIPCSERLPEVHWFDRDICYSDTVLVTEETKYGSKDVKMGYRTTEGGGEIWWDAREGTGFAGEIIAWMPLPEPCGGQNEAD